MHRCWGRLSALSTISVAAFSYALLTCVVCTCSSDCMCSNNLQIREDDAYHFLPTNEHHPLCELVAFWNTPHVRFVRWAPRYRPGRLKKFVHLQGTTSPRFLLLDNTSGQQSYYGTRRGHPAANCGTCS